LRSIVSPLDATKSRVLLVDDDADLCASLAKGLAREGFRSFWVTSAKAALLQLAAAPEIDIVVTDLVMPGMGGLEFLRKLSANRDRRPLAVIVMTGSPSLEAAVTALRLSAIDFLQKPVEAHEVAIAVRHAIGHLEKASRTALPKSVHYPDMLAGLWRLQRKRASTLPASVLNETCWNMLLFLATAEVDGRVVTSTELYSIAGATLTTSFRKLEELAEAGLVSRTADPEDGRRVIVRLIPEASRKIRTLIAEVQGRHGFEVPEGGASEDIYEER